MMTKSNKYRTIVFISAITVIAAYLIYSHWPLDHSKKFIEPIDHAMFNNISNNEQGKDTKTLELFQKQQFKVSSIDPALIEKQQIKTHDIGPDLHHPFQTSSQFSTEIDGCLRETIDNQLVIERKVRDLFDYFLATVGERELTEIKKTMASYIDRYLSKKSAVQAKKIFQDYIDFQEAWYDKQIEMTMILGSLEEIDLVENYEHLLNERNLMRREYLGEEVVEAFFEEETYDLYTLERMRISTDSSLTKTKKAELIEDLAHQLPKSYQTLIQNYENMKAAIDKEATWQKQLLSDNEKNARRRENWGTETAARLEKLDRQRTNWEMRLNNYFNQKEEILSSSGINNENKESIIAELKTFLFSDTECFRLSAIEAMRKIK